MLFNYAYADNSIVEEYKQSRKVVVDTQKAELCFADTQDCHKVLIGKTTPKGVFPLTLHTTAKKDMAEKLLGLKKKRIFCLHCIAYGWENHQSADKKEFYPITYQIVS